MTKRISGEQVEHSASYRQAKNRASDYAEDPKKLNDLLDRATRKANARRGPLGEIWENLMACLRLLRAYASGRYKNIPWASLLSIIAAVVYFVMPTDLIPDFLLGFGYIDDAALLSWIFTAVSSDVQNFLDWEQAGTEVGPDDAEVSDHE